METISGEDLKDLKKRLPVIEVEKKFEAKIGKRPIIKEANVKESCFIKENGEIIGFYLIPEDVPIEVKTFAILMNNELLGRNVPKQVMSRIKYNKNGDKIRTKQFSTIIGAVKPEIFKRRYKPGLSHIHLVESAQKYIKIVYKWADYCSKMVKELSPELYERQKELLKAQKIKLGDLWTSSIANFNGAVNNHLDGANIKLANNIIYFKRKDSLHGNLHIPEYGAVVDSVNDSLVFYPAYKHIHSVDEIIPTTASGYRNSLVLYPLNIKWE